MSQIKNFAIKFTKGFLKTILIVSLLLILLLGSVLIAIQFPTVQTKLANKATEYLSEAINFPIHVERVNINWFDEILLQGVTVHDPKKGKMIVIEEVALDYRIISLTKGKFNIDKVTLKNGKVNVIRYAPDGMTNITDFIDAFRELAAPKEKSSKPVPFTIDEVELQNMYFSYHDQRKEYLKDIFDHNHFILDSIYANAYNFRAIADTLQFNVTNLTTNEPNIDLKVHQLTTFYTLTKRNMTFENLQTQIGHSQIKKYLKFSYENINDMSDFNTKVDVASQLDHSIINFEDLSKFAFDLKPYKEIVNLTGSFKGQVVNFSVNDLELEFGEQSKIKGNISFSGLPDFFETFIEFKFKHTSIVAADLKQYLNSNSYTVLKKFGTIAGNGEFIGFPQDFVTKGSFNTKLGKLDSDIRLDAKKENLKPTYQGNLKTYALNLGKMMDLEKYVQLIDMEGHIDGSGFKVENAEINLNATIKRIGILDYNYKNIKTNAKLSKSTFNGFLSVKDTNLILEAKGKLDLTKEQEIFDIHAQLKRANLKQLHLSDVETFIKTDMVLNFKGTEIDEIVGKANFKNTYLLFNRNKEISLDSLYLVSTKDGTNRTVKLNSDLLSMEASGDFNYTTLYDDVLRIYSEYEMNFKNDRGQIAQYYSRNKNSSLANYNIDFSINIKNLNSLFEIYTPGLFISQGSKIAGNFTNGKNSILNINTHIDTLFYKNNGMYNTDIQLSTSKLSDSSNILAMANLISNKQTFDKLPETKNLILEAIWENGNIGFITKIQEVKTNNNLDLMGNLAFLENKKMLSFTKSNISVLNKKWIIAEDNKIYFKKNEISFKNFALGNRDEFIAINGTISEDKDDIAELKIGNFDIKTIAFLIPGYNFDGTLNANVTIKDLFHNLDLAGNLSIKDLSMDNFILGDVVGTSEWDNNSRRLLLNVNLARKDISIINLNGYIHSNPETEKEEINLTAKVDNADLEILGPIVKDVMSNLSGKVKGDFKIQGDIQNVSVQGEGFVKGGKFTIDYLGTTYFFNDPIYMEENKIGFRKLKLIDEFNNTGIISGGIEHDGFKSFLVNISGYMNNLQVLNTTEKDNNLFYGTAFVSGDMEILGPFSNLSIKANAKSNKGTRISIPLNSYSGLERESFIKFQARKEVKKDTKVKEDVDLSGINLDFNFELTQDAYAEIIFDKRAGDIIRGYGNGNIRMTIDTRGDFNMYGSYRIAKGAYNYTLAGLISKEFTIEPNSSISWTGDPYGGILDVKAMFETKVSVAPLMDAIAYDSTLIKSEKLRTHPVKVILDIDGELMSPQIGLDIDILPTGQEATIVAAKFESDIKRNEQELNRQVFGLLVLGNFQPTTSNFKGSGGPASNVSQLLTNQLSNWLSQVDENLIIDINLNGLDKDALSTFNLRLSYTLLDGRLRISRDGTFSNFQNSTQQSLSNIAGEWTVEYLLNKDGKFRLKLYNKNNQNYLLNNFSSGSYSSAGFSILHTQSFNSLDDLFNKNKKKNTVEPTPTQQNNTDVPPDNKNQLPDSTINFLMPPRKQFVEKNDLWVSSNF